MKLKDNRKLQIVFFVVSMVVLFGIYVPVMVWSKDNVFKKNIYDTECLFFQKLIVKFETIIEKDELVGWIVGIDTPILEAHVVLRDAITGEEKVLQTQMEKSTPDKFDLKAEIKESGKCQEILIYVIHETGGENEIEGKKISTNQYVCNGKIYGYNPTTIDLPQFIDDNMNRIISQGLLLGYNSEYRAWLYQNEDSLYWIVDSTIEKNRNDNLFLFFHLYTNQTADLPANRQQYGFDNMDFYFKDWERQFASEERYRVAVRKLDVTYPITYIRSGEFDKDKNKQSWVVEYQMFEEQ